MRADYVEALKAERAGVEINGDRRRLAEIDAQLDAFAPRPKAPVVETPSRRPAAARKNRE